MKNKFTKAIFISLVAYMIFCLYSTAHIYKDYKYLQYKIHEEQFQLSIDLDARHKENFIKNGREHTVLSTIYRIGINLHSTEVPHTDNFTLKKLHITNIDTGKHYNLNIEHERNFDKIKHNRFHFVYEKIKIPKSEYSNMEVLIEFELQFKNGLKKTYLKKGVIKKDFNCFFSWYTFDKFMSV